MQFLRATKRKNQNQKISQQERGEEGGGLVLMLGAYWYACVCWDRKHFTTTALHLFYPLMTDVGQSVFILIIFIIVIIIISFVAFA